MLKIQVRCSTCNDALSAEIGVDAYGSVTILVDPHAECLIVEKEKPEITMYYDDLLEHLGSTKVLVSYFKKDGDYRTLVGFLGVPHENKPGLVYFVEKEFENSDAEVKCLIKKNIASITDIDAQQRYKVMGGLIQ